MGKHSQNSGRFGPRHNGGPRRARPGVRKTEPRRQFSDGEETYSLSDPKSRRRGALESAPARLRVERERRGSRAKRIAAISLSVVGVLVVAAAIGVYAYARSIQGKMQDKIIKQEKVIAQLEKAKPQEPYTMLLLGADKRPDETQYRTDTMILAKIDPKTKQVWMLSIPRDTRVSIPGKGYAKINQAHYYGGPELAIKTVSKFTGTPINHYMEVDFTGFEAAVDALGGVWVDVPVAIDDWKASSHSPHHRASRIDAGYQLLDGEHALTFVRSRDFVDADFSRMKNQQIFFKALADQVAKSSNLAKLPGVVSSVAPYIQTDMSLMEMIRTAQALRGAGSKSVYTATVKGEWKSPYVWPDEEQMAELIDAMKSGRSFDGTQTPSATGSTQTSAEDPEPAVVDPAKITVTVRNGGGIAGCAKQASSILKAQAFNVMDVGNANQFVYEQTLIVYKGNKAAAQQVAKVLPPGTKLVESRGMYSFNTEILVVVGKDWDVSKVPVTPIKTN